MALSPELDEEEAVAMATAFVDAALKLEAEGRKFQKLTMTGPRRNLEYISNALRVAREAALNPDGTPMTQADVSDRTEWSPSKIIRIEGGLSAPSKPDIQFLAELYGLDKKTEKDLIARRKG